MLLIQNAMRSLCNVRNTVISSCAFCLLMQPPLHAENRVPVWTVHPEGFATAGREHEATESPSAPMLIDSMLVARLCDGRLLAVNQQTGKRYWASPRSKKASENLCTNDRATNEQPTLGFAHLQFADQSLIVNYDHSTEVVSAFDLNRSGRLLWRVPCMGNAKTRTLVRPTNEKNGVGLMAVTSGHLRYTMLDGLTGETVASFGLPIDRGFGFGDGGVPEELLCVSSPGKCFFIRGRAVLAVNTDAQSLQWQAKITPPFSDAMKARFCCGHLFIIDGDRCVVLDERTGEVVWSLDDLDSFRVVQNNGRASVIMFRNGKMTDYKCQTGEVLWSVSFDATSISGHPCMYGQTIVIPTNDRTLLFYNGTTGNRVHHIDFESKLGSVFQVNTGLISFDGYVLKKLLSGSFPALTFGKKSYKIGNRKLFAPQP